MPVRFLNSLFDFRLPPRRRKQAGSSCDSVHLLGNQCFEMEVAGTARFQEVLQAMAPEGLSRGCSFPCFAELSIDGLLDRKSQYIDIAIDGETVGYCPSYLATRYFEWLGEWGLEHAEVHCDARILRKQCRDTVLAVFLDIDPQFRMTTNRVQQNEGYGEPPPELRTA